MLGTLRMDIQTCFDEYSKMAPEIFPIEGLLQTSGFGRLYTVVRGQQRFDVEPLESAIKRCLREYLGRDGTAGEDTFLRFEASKHRTDSSCKVYSILVSQIHPFGTEIRQIRMCNVREIGETLSISKLRQSMGRS